MANLTAHPTSIDGLWTLEMRLFEDDRGSVMEFYRESDFVAAGLPSLGERPQVNAPWTVPGAIRGIHAEFAHKYLAVASGIAYAVIVDLRRESPTFGKWQGFTLRRGQGLFVSRGIGNSFQCIGQEPSVYLYYFELEWSPDMDGVYVNPLDPDLAIDWPIKEGDGMVVSEKDSNHPFLRDL